MTAPEPTPTAEHTDAVARALRKSTAPTFDRLALDLLTSTDPAVHAAMLDALVRAGVLTEDICEATPDYDASRRLVTRWEVAP